ncbi:MAG: hypothetical protein GXP24_10185 [Planctomycetes bacterium]|nr:hypothetical protein [Planctomycetota bacterium]
MTNSAKLKFGLFATLAFSLFGLAWLVFHWLFPPFTPPVLPVPNGYDDLLRAAEMLAPRTGLHRDNMDADELAAIVEQNKPALKLAREALQKECMVTVDWTPGQKGFEPQWELSSSMRSLARALEAAAWQAKRDGKIDDAIEYGLDSFELAQATANGGLIVDRMVSQPVYYMGLRTLRNQVDSLSGIDCERLLKQLKISRLELEPIDEVIRRDLAFGRKVNGFYMSFMMTGMVKQQVQQTKDHMKEAGKRYEAYRTLLQTHLALRAFQLDNNRYPEKLDELLPDYLPAVPQDSFASGPLSYHPQADSYLLYSLGSDGIDDNGVETQDNVKGDLLLEVDD